MIPISLVYTTISHICLIHDSSVNSLYIYKSSIPMSYDSSVNVSSCKKSFPSLTMTSMPMADPNTIITHVACFLRFPSRREEGTSLGLPVGLPCVSPRDLLKLLVEVFRLHCVCRLYGLYTTKMDIRVNGWVPSINWAIKGSCQYAIKPTIPLNMKVWAPGRWGWWLGQRGVWMMGSLQNWVNDLTALLLVRFTH